MGRGQSPVKCAPIAGDAVAQLLKQDDRAPLSVIIGFSDSIVKACHEQIVAFHGSAFDQYSGEGSEREQGGIVHSSVIA